MYITVMLGRRRKRKGSPIYEEAPDISARVDYLLSVVEIPWVNKERVFCFRTYNSSARAYARIRGLDKVWQKAISHEPAYAIEVISEYFDSLPPHKQDEVLLHELCHIPQTFSGALLPHTKKGHASFHGKLRQLTASYRKGK